MREGKTAEVEAIKAEVKADADKLLEIEKEQTELDAEIKKRMMLIPNIIDDSVPIGEDDSKKC